MSIDMAEGCPKCGDTVGMFSRGYLCKSSKCGGYWVSVKDFERECIARDLAGTRAKSKKEQVAPEELKDQLDALVDLVRLNTLKEIDEVLSAAIDGRKKNEDDTFADQVRKGFESNGLKSMREWLRLQIKETEDE